MPEIVFPCRPERVPSELLTAGVTCRKMLPDLLGCSLQSGAAGPVLTARGRGSCLFSVGVPRLERVQFLAFQACAVSEVCALSWAGHEEWDSEETLCG